jgi:UDP-N-acetylglucosamine diphosphorylase/glucosamine-1-phosphate N-acetyltransferase
MNYILFDDYKFRAQLLPLAFTRPISKFRIGIFTLEEKWAFYLNSSNISALSVPYLQQKFKPEFDSRIQIYINSNVLPCQELIVHIQNLKNGEALVQNDVVIAYCTHAAIKDIETIVPSIADKIIEYKPNIVLLTQLWHIFSFNSAQLIEDWNIVKKNRKSYLNTDIHTKVYNENSVFIEEGVKIRAAILNAEDGPIYIGKNVDIQEGAIIKGPIAICEGAVVNMGAKLRQGTTIGPYSKVGGEISNSVIFGYSNKAHDGFLGNSVLGEWCNLGADTNTSNLKNNYSNVKLYSYATQQLQDTGIQFCGLIMGDHSKASINTMFNTGTVVGIHANVFGSGFPPKYVPSFSWGGSEGFEPYLIEKALEVAAKVMQRRNMKLSEADIQIAKHIERLKI